jgi:hypothetical protein
VSKCPKCGAAKSKTSPDGAFMCGAGPIGGGGFYESPLCIQNQRDQATATLDRVREAIKRAEIRGESETIHAGGVRWATFIIKRALEGK